MECISTGFGFQIGRFFADLTITVGIIALLIVGAIVFAYIGGRKKS